MSEETDRSIDRLARTIDRLFPGDEGEDGGGAEAELPPVGDDPAPDPAEALPPTGEALAPDPAETLPPTGEPPVPDPGEALPPAEDPSALHPADEVPPVEEGEAPAPAAAAGSDATPDEEAEDLDSLVSAYLSATGVAREEIVERIRARAGRAHTGVEVDVVVDAVERLGAAGRAEDDPAPLALAATLTTPAVAARLTGRLGAVTEEAERERLIDLATALGPHMVNALVDALAETDDRSARRAYMDTLVRMGDDALPVMEEMVEDPRWFVVRNAVLLFGEIGGETSARHLTTTLGHDDPRVRSEALLALAKLGGDDAIQLVSNKYDDPDPTVRAAAAMAAGELAYDRAVRHLSARLEEESDEEVIIAIARSLGALGDPGAVPALEKKATTSLFSRSPVPVRIAAYRALASIGTPHAMELVEEATDDRDVEVRSVADRLLAED